MAYRPQVKTENGMVDLPLEAEQVKNTLLWENANPNTAFAGNSSNPIPISNIYDFKYYIVKFKKYRASSDVEYAIFSTSSHDWCQMMTFWWTSNVMLIVGREVVLVNNTTNIVFGDGRYINNGSSGTGNDYCIPLAIYGTNSL